MAISLNCFAAYFDIGVGDGTGMTSIDGTDVSSSILKGKSDGCDGDCVAPAFEYGFRVGMPLSQSVILAGEFEGTGVAYSNDDKYLVFNNFFVGPSMIFYPARHLQLAGSLGFAWTSNRDNSQYVDPEDGLGVGTSFSVAYDVGKKNGALLGAKFFSSTVKLEDSGDYSTTMGASLFVRFVHKD